MPEWMSFIVIHCDVSTVNLSLIQAPETRSSVMELITNAKRPVVSAAEAANLLTVDANDDTDKRNFAAHIDGRNVTLENAYKYM